MKNRRERCLLAAAVLILFFIWGHSMATASSSAAESLAVGNILAPFLELLVGKGAVTDYLVRKLAHFTEFAALGVVLRAIAASRGKKGLCILEHAALKGLAAALIDESIQLFAEGRSAEIRDVLLDMSGVLFGMACAGAVILIAGTVRKKP